MAEAKSLSLTNLDQGLTADEVQRAVQSGQKNAPTKPLTKSIQQIVSGNFLTLFNLINIVLGVLWREVRIYGLTDSFGEGREVISTNP